MSIIIQYDQLAAECMARCDELSTHTETLGQVKRRYLSPPMRDVHNAVIVWAKAAGMTTRVDPVGNLVATRGSSNADAKTLLIGSHLDTVPNAGKYDGILGVVAGIAAVKALGAIELPFAIDVIGFSEEEGVRFSTPYLGSRAVAGSFDPAWLAIEDLEGHSMRSVIEEFGLDPGEISSAAYAPDHVLGFVEAHIEQGPVLSRMNLPVAAVDAIVGQSRLKLLFRGQAGHAGTMPMPHRADALVAAARFVIAVSQFGGSIDGLRATVGYMNVLPNVRNVIPDLVELSLDIRHADDQVRLAAVDDLCRRASEHAGTDGVTCEIVERQDQPATLLDTHLTDIFKAAMVTGGIEPHSMISGAGHDAVSMAPRFPTAMLFIRQPNGISHHPDEDVQQSDVAVAIEVLTNFIRRLATQH